MAGHRPEERVARSIVFQAWRTVTFLHWRVDPALVAAHLPPALVPDTVDGSAWIGLTPFHVARYSLFGLPAVPMVTSFNETNLRTYVRGPDGRDGLWFFSLDVDSLANAGAGRIGGFPYFLSAMSVDGDGPARYRCRRHGADAHHDITIQPGDPVRPDDELAAQLAGRWRAYHAVGPRLVEVPVEHEPWPLRGAALVACDETLIARAGLAVQGPPDLVHYADGVDARLGPPRLVT
jgi:uncharacterized protein YqjF (DUF2071 family)